MNFCLQYTLYRDIKEEKKNWMSDVSKKKIKKFVRTSFFRPQNKLFLINFFVLRLRLRKIAFHYQTYHQIYFSIFWLVSCLDKKKIFKIKFFS